MLPARYASRKPSRCLIDKCCESAGKITELMNLRQTRSAQTDNLEPLSESENYNTWATWSEHRTSVHKKQKKQRKANETIGRRYQRLDCMVDWRSARQLTGTWRDGENWWVVPRSPIFSNEERKATKTVSKWQIEQEAVFILFSGAYNRTAPGTIYRREGVKLIHYLITRLLSVSRWPRRVTTTQAQHASIRIMWLTTHRPAATGKITTTKAPLPGWRPAAPACLARRPSDTDGPARRQIAVKSF